ncbi:hypothetical protein GCM10009676_42480 [Prauserella halophila]|uniref:Addiction module antidote protein, HigA family n=1 Tax=Prauserella halophila TaxID=185641 RepID=A0ABP4H5K9_9PSEU|nr:hypothetical protein [Prauserella halophila]MCP2237880.1 hypothetical protein [Prauserella halophila]
MTTTDKAHEPIHPGQILREEFLEPLGVSVNRRLALAEIGDLDTITPTAPAG